MLVINTVVVSTNYKEIKMEDNPNRLPFSYEFYEIFTRNANMKYLKANVSRSLPEEVERLIS